jgi:hypothetical protein
MSGLRFFGDMMLRAIEIERNAREYRAACEQARAENLPKGQPTQFWHKANEGLCAVNIIMRIKP